MKYPALFLLLSVPFTAAWCQQPARPRIGVALEGGGAKGLAHIGVLQWFEEHHIPIDYLAGTSMGGLVGGLYATGYTPAEIQDIVQKMDWNQALSGATAYKDLSFRRKEDLRALPNGLELGLRNGLQTPGGLSSGQGVRFVIDRYVLPYSRGGSFDDLPTPFRCVATDLLSGKPVVFSKGSLPDALRATMSIPGVFSPVKMDGKLLADGALLDNLPTDVVKQMGADIVIGVHLSTGDATPKNLTSIFQVAGGSLDVMIDANVLRAIEHADILVTIDLPGFTTLDFMKAGEIVPKGVEAAAAKANLLSRLSLNDEDWKQYVAKRESRMVKRDMPIPQFVEVKGGNPDLQKDLRKAFAGFVGQPLDRTRLEHAINQQLGAGSLLTLSYSLADRDGETGLLLTADDKDYSPPWLKPGFTIDGSDPDNVQFVFGGRITFLNIGGYRSEVRTDFAVGSTYSFSSEYYHPLKPTSRWFVAPYVFASRSPLNVFFNDTFFSEYKINQVGGGADLGYGFDRFSELRVGYEAGYGNVTRYIGDPLYHSFSGRIGATRARYALDHLDDPVIPRSGIGLTGNIAWVDANPGATSGFASGQVDFEAFRRISKPASAYFTFSGGTTFGFEQTGLPLFSLGGPGRLAAYGVNQFVTDQYLYARVGYLRQVAYLPTFFGQGVYLNAYFEGATPLGLHGDPLLADDGAIGIVAKTILGPMMVGGAVGQGGRHKVFFQLGRVF